MNKVEQASQYIDLIRVKSNEALLFLSLGKDSLVLLDLVYPKFDRIVCVFMYFVKNLEHINRWINWTKAKYPKIEFVQVPHWNLTYILRGGMYCVPNPKVKLLKLADVVKAMQLTHGVYYTFLGMKKADGMNRRLMLKGYEVNGYENKMVAFVKESITNTFGQFLADNGLKQARIAETEKYAHVTFFFNGGVEEPNEGEDRILVASPKISTFDLMPEMSAPEVSEKLNAAVRSGKYDAIIVNFANCDMVGHTGIIPAAIKAVETVDACVGSLAKAVIEMNGNLFITADHGNADKMLDENGEPFTAHTTNPVPFVAVNCGEGVELRDGGKLCDIAPTMLQMLGLDKPAEMTGVSLIK